MSGVLRGDFNFWETLALASPRQEGGCLVEPLSPSSLRQLEQPLTFVDVVRVADALQCHIAGSHDEPGGAAPRGLREVSRQVNCENAT